MPAVLLFYCIANDIANAFRHWNGTRGWNVSLTSLLDIPCSILDIQKQSRGGAEAEISIEYWGDSFLLGIMRIAGDPKNCVFCSKLAQYSLFCESELYQYVCVDALGDNRTGVFRLWEEAEVGHPVIWRSRADGDHLFHRVGADHVDCCVWPDCRNDLRGKTLICLRRKFSTPCGARGTAQSAHLITAPR